ncbi:MAG: SpoIID/LytB domain-containing protein, partial [Alicyclobacillus sp.]|nr:SpoIID/LytB domain-containing protein [Alicyclobacillus sp.]
SRPGRHPARYVRLPAPRAAALGAGLAFAAMVLVPAAMALVLHAGRPWPDVQVLWRDSPDMRTTIKVYRVQTDQVVRVPLRDYIVNVLAAELGPNAPMPALEAAAVACRTYAVYALRHPASDSALARRHHAQLTDSAVLDLPWLTVAEQQDRYGPNFTLASARLQQAVANTAGQVITYRGQPIPAFMFPLSVGRTRDARWVWGRSLPYLPSVACPDDRSAPDRTQVFTFPQEEAARLLGVQVGQLDISRLRVAKADPLGYAASVTDGHHTWAGMDFAARLGLPSACVRLRTEPSGTSPRLRVEVTGAGAGIGMSLHEAQALANRGRSWQEIVRTFYPGTEVAEKSRW